MKSIYISFLATMILSGTTTLTFAADDFDSQFQNAFAQFEKRGESPKFAETCAALAEQAANTTGINDVQKYDAMILQSRCLYYVGMKATTEDAKKELFGKGKNVADAAKNVQKDRAEAYYYFGINLGRWGEANGILKSLSERKNLQRAEEIARIKNAVVDGKVISGAEIDGYGPNRTLARMYYKLPGMFGGDNEKAEKLLREAIAKQSPDFLNSLNVVYLAEVLIANGKKDEARKILDELLQYEGSPEKYNAKRVAETTDEIADAKTLRKSLGN